jgi:hypothetical protein
VTLGWEPQWLLVKSASGTSNWWLADNMRGMTASNDTNYLSANTANGEGGPSALYGPTATGFNARAQNTSETYIYIAIRRGPMKVPTTGTRVFTPTLATFSGTTVTNTGYVVDMVINKNGTATVGNNFVLDRLRGSDNGAIQQTLSTNSASAEVASSGRVALTGSATIQNGFLEQNTIANNIVWSFSRAPGFFDEVCYTGTGAVGNAVSHNLGVAPELIIVKGRSGTVGTNDWQVLANISSSGYSKLFLDLTDAALGPYNYSSNAGLAAQPTSTTFTVNNVANFNNGSTNYVAYLFASCPGVSKVGSYTGTGTTKQVDCGFAAGARFVLIKRTDSTGDWYVWDSARGIVSGNDPYLLLNSTEAEVTSTDYVDTYSAGFEISSTAPAAINASGGTFIFLAIA